MHNHHHHHHHHYQNQHRRHHHHLHHHHHLNHSLQTSCTCQTKCVHIITLLRHHHNPHRHPHRHHHRHHHHHNLLQTIFIITLSISLESPILLAVKNNIFHRHSFFQTNHIKSNWTCCTRWTECGYTYLGTHTLIRLCQWYMPGALHILCQYVQCKFQQDMYILYIVQIAHHSWCVLYAPVVRVIYCRWSCFAETDCVCSVVLKKKTAVKTSQYCNIYCCQWPIFRLCWDRLRLQYSA